MWLCDPSNSWFTFSTSLSLPLHVRTLAIQIQNRFGSASTNSALNFVTPFRLIRRSHRSSFVPLSSRKPHFPAAAVSISSILFAHTEMHARLLLRMHAPISFAPASSPDAASFAPAAADVGGAVCLGYGIAIAVGVLVFISTVMLASYICVRAKAGAAAVLLADDDDDGGAPAASAVVVLGLDGPAIDALYPKFLHVGVGDDDNACAGAQCAICLGEFVAGDALRRGPGCGHRFHAECVERWLRVSATCPVCRDSPLPSPMATPLAEAVPLAAHAR
nr:putative RING-H2 finger protein ATL69 [Oryza sativa Japonica Group]